MQTPPGWYRDPTNPAHERWWDGRVWGHVTRPAPQPASHAGGRLRDAVAVTAVLLVTVALVVLVAVARHGGDAAELPTRTPRDQPAETDAAAGPAERAELPAAGSDFVENTGAYSLRVGEDWDETDVPNGIGWYTGSGSRRFRDNVTAIVEDLPRAVPLDEYVRLSVQTIGRAGVSYEEVERHDLVLVDGRSAVVIDYRSSQSGYTLGHRVVIAVRNRVAVSVTFTAEAERFDDAVRDVAPYLRSVQVR